MEPSRRDPLARGRALASDVLLVVGVGAVQVLGCWASERIGQSADWRPLDAWAYLLLAAAPAVLVLRRPCPRAGQAAADHGSGRMGQCRI